jgi:microcystin-dependent protein
MPSTFDPLLRLELQATGENATTWGIKTNTNLDLLAESIAGAVTLNVAGSGDFTLSTANGAADEARQAILILTGLLTGNRNIIVPSSPKNYTVINQTTGAFAVTLKQSAGTGLPIPAGGPTITVCTSTTCVDSIGATPYSKTLLAATSVAAAQTTLQVPPPTPTGVILEYGGTAAPSDWLLCNGDAVSRSTYAALFAVIGTAYGAGDGSTTFNVPDRRDRFGIGASGTVARGSTGGSTTSGGTALTTAQMPSHTHTGTTSTAGDHSHTVSLRDFGGGGGGVQNLTDGSGGGPSTAYPTNTAGAHNHTFTTDATGSGDAHTHSVTPPYVASNYIIKT